MERRTAIATLAASLLTSAVALLVAPPKGRCVFIGFQDDDEPSYVDDDHVYQWQADVSLSDEPPRWKDLVGKEVRDRHGRLTHILLTEGSWLKGCFIACSQCPIRKVT